MTPADEKLRLRLRAVASALDAAFNPGMRGDERKYTFAVIIGEISDIEKYSEKTQILYISNGDRRDAQVLARAFLIRHETLPHVTKDNS